MKLTDILQRYLLRDHKVQKPQIFSGNEENFKKNGETLLEERISLFNGKTNVICCFSVDDLNSMIVVDKEGSAYYKYRSFRGVWGGNLVQVKSFGGERSNKLTCLEIAVATEIGTHRNVHRILGYCLHTKYPVLVYEWEENGTLQSRINNYNGKSKETPLEWKDRLRIAWEIAHAVAYLHTAFDWPTVHRDLKPENVYLGQDDSVRLSGFSFSISIPEGKKHEKDILIMETQGYLAPDYVNSGMVAESCDVFAFGAILLVLLSGKCPFTFSQSNQGRVSLLEWVSECRAVNSLGDVVDPTITRNGLTVDEVHLKAIVELALSCSAED